MQDHEKASTWLARLVRIRMADWVIAAALLTLLVWLIAPHQIPVSLYKLSLVALAAVAGYWIDRSLFPYARPDFFFELRHGAGERAQESSLLPVQLDTGGGAHPICVPQTARKSHLSRLSLFLYLTPVQ